MKKIDFRAGMHSGAFTSGENVTLVESGIGDAFDAAVHNGSFDGDLSLAIQEAAAEAETNGREAFVVIRIGRDV